MLGLVAAILAGACELRGARASGRAGSIGACPSCAEFLCTSTIISANLLFAHEASCCRISTKIVNQEQKQILYAGVDDKKRPSPLTLASFSSRRRSSTMGSLAVCAREALMLASLSAIPMPMPIPSEGVDLERADASSEDDALGAEGYGGYPRDRDW